MIQRNYQLATNSAGTTYGGVYVDAIENCTIVGVSWTAAARWQAAIGNLFYWLAFDNAATVITSQIYSHISNFAFGGCFTAAGTSGKMSDCYLDAGMSIPWKLGQRLYVNLYLVGTGPTDVYCMANIQTRA